MAIIGAYGYTTGILLCPQCHDRRLEWAGERGSARPILAETLAAFYADAKPPCCDACGATLTAAPDTLTAAILAAEVDYE